MFYDLKIISPIDIISDNRLDVLSHLIHRRKCLHGGIFLFPVAVDRYIRLGVFSVFFVSSCSSNKTHRHTTFRHHYIPPEKDYNTKPLQAMIPSQWFQYFSPWSFLHAPVQTRRMPDLHCDYRHANYHHGRKIRYRSYRDLTPTTVSGETER